MFRLCIALRRKPLSVHRIYFGIKTLIIREINLTYLSIRSLPPLEFIAPPPDENNKRESLFTN